MPLFSFFPNAFFSSAPEDVAIREICGLGAPGEMVSLSFFVSSPVVINEVEAEISELECASETIAHDRLDLHVVKVWEQAGIGVYRSEAVDVAELLLKDDRQSLRDSYSRHCAHWKNPRHWKHALRAPKFYRAPPIRLQGPVRTSLEAHAKKQIWLSVKIPQEAVPGFYRGHISFKIPNEPQQQLPVQIEVLPIRLLQPPHDFFIWYRGTLDCVFSQYHIPEREFEAQLRDIYEHGFTSFSLNENKAHLLQKALDIAHGIGFRGNVVLMSPWPTDIESIDFKGMTPIYYVSDEADLRGKDFILSHRDEWRKAKARGRVTMASILYEIKAKEVFLNGNENSTPDVLLLHLLNNLHYFAMRSQFASAQKESVGYYWLSHTEKPNVHRVLSGLYLWKSRAQGIAPYCYQHLPGKGASPFNDFDEPSDDAPGKNTKGVRKSLMTTYPAAAGSIPTLQWKGLSAGITDLKYLITLNFLLEAASARDTPELSSLSDTIQQQVDAFLGRLSLNRIEIGHPNQSEPYSHIASWEYQAFREQMARDIVTLQNALSRV